MSVEAEQPQGQQSRLGGEPPIIHNPPFGGDLLEKAKRWREMAQRGVPEGREYVLDEGLNPDSLVARRNRRE